MKKWIFMILFTVLAYTATLWANVSTKGLGFVAPQVHDKANVDDPHLGEIVFDTLDSMFYGRDSASTWVNLSSGGASGVPAGSIVAFGGTTAPTGYLMADGSAVSRTTYADLFAAIGTAYGAGDGSTTFNIPDLRGRFLRGTDGGAGRDPDRASRTAMASGGNTGDTVGSVQGHAFQSITGSFESQVINSANHSGAFTYGTFTSNSIWSNGSANRTTTVSMSASATGSNSQASSNETRPVNANVNFIIKI